MQNLSYSVQYKKPKPSLKDHSVIIENTTMKDIGELVILLIFLGSSLAQEKDYTTKICDQSKGKEFFARLDSCVLLAEQDFFAKIFDSDIQQASCDLLSARVLLFFFLNF